jgi:endo-1,4-beta-xylanase
MNKLLLFSLLLLLFFGCRKNDIPACDDSDSLYSYSNFPVGVAIDFQELSSNMTYKEIAIRQFNSVTPENLFKPEYLHPEPGFFNWADADSLVGFCIANNKRIHGHTLIWHQQLPQWIQGFQGNSHDWDLLMKIHIQTIVSHFKGKVSGWDVVNEAFNEDGTLRNSIWLQKLGAGYIEKAFLYAHEADPDVLLFYNDYNLESNPNKRNSVLSLLNNIRNRGIQVDGIGIQMHVNIMSTEATQLASALQSMINYGYRIHLSEMDVSINPLGRDISPTQELFAEQANLLGELVQQYKQVPPQYQYGITFWGISDKTSWIKEYFNREDYPLLYDDNYNPKPAYCKLKETL